MEQKGNLALDEADPLVKQALLPLYGEYSSSPQGNQQRLNKTKQPRPSSPKTEAAEYGPRSRVKSLQPSDWEVSVNLGYPRYILALTLLCIGDIISLSRSSGF